MARPERCPKGHRLDDANCYEELRNGRTVYRCRKCRAAQRRTPRKNPKPTLALADAVARTRPGPDETRRAVEMWANGTAGHIVRDAGITATQLADAAGIHPHTAREWLRGKRSPQARHHERAAAVLVALGALHTNREGADPTDGIGDQILLIGGRADRNGPWHASPPHNGQRIGISEDWYGSGNPTGPRWADYWPCTGLVNSHAESERLVAAHGYLDDPRTLEYATACHGTPGWKHDCPNGDGTTGGPGSCGGLMPATAAWSIHMGDLYNGHGCQPGCPHGRANQNPQRVAEPATPGDPHVTAREPHDTSPVGR